MRNERMQEVVKEEALKGLISFQRFPYPASPLSIFPLPLLNVSPL
jgi:hypothetical protein